MGHTVRPDGTINKRLYDAYQKGGAGAVYKIANKLKLPYSYCGRCECDTPTMKHVTSVCGVCGTTKTETAKHTPGPWKADFLDEDNGWILDKKSNYIAEIVTSDEENKFIKNPDEREANARLIASAPELLEALKAAQKILHPLVMKMKVKDHFNEHNVLANVIVKAIAKAEGRDVA